MIYGSDIWILRKDQGGLKHLKHGNGEGQTRLDGCERCGGSGESEREKENIINRKILADTGNRILILREQWKTKREEEEDITVSGKI